MSGSALGRALGSTLDAEPPVAPSSWRERGQPRTLQVHTVEAGRIVLLQVSGAVDAISTPALGEALQPWLRPAQQTILDLRHVEYVESPGLRQLIAAGDQLRQDGGQIRLIAAPGSRVERTLHLAGLDRRMPIFHSGPDAWVGRADAAADPAGEGAGAADRR